MRATAAAVGPGAVRGARGGMALGRGGVLNVIKDKLLKYKEKTEIREISKHQGLTCDLPCIFIFFTKNLKLSQGRYAHFGSRVSPKTTLNAKFEKKAYMSQK